MTKGLRSGIGMAALAVLSCVVALLAVGCTRVGTNTTLSASAWTVPGVLRIGFYEDVDSLNPTLSLQSFEIPIQELLFDGLVNYSAGYRLQGDAAAEVPTLNNGGISRDGRTIIYHLRHNIKFSDGVPLTSADVKYTWQQIMNPLNNTPNRVPADEVSRIDTPDDYTVVVHLKEPYAPFIGTFLQIGGSPNGAILPKHLLDRYRDLNQIPFNSHPIGSGPFILERWDPGSGFAFKPNPGYWRGPPRLREILIKVIPNQNTLLTALRTHEIDWYYDVPEPQYDQIVGLPGIRLTKEYGFSIEHVKFNCRSPLLQDVRVRRAIAYAIDWHRLATDVYLNLGLPGMADISPRSWAYDPNVRPYPFEPKRATALLADAGWRPGANGVLEKSGVPLHIQLMTVVGVSARLKAEELIQQELRAIGIAIDIHNYPANLVFATYAANGLLTRGHYDLALVTMDLDPDPDNRINFSPDQLPPVGQNRSFFVDHQVGEWENAAVRTYDPVVRKRYYWMVQQRIHDQVPIHGIVWRPTINAVNTSFKGFQPGGQSDFWNPYDWSI